MQQFYSNKIKSVKHDQAISIFFLFFVKMKEQY